MLTEVEREADDKNLFYQERSKLRETHAYPIMVVFEKWLVNEYGKVLPKSPIVKAIKYCYDIYYYDEDYTMDLAELLPLNCLRKIS